MFSWLPFRDEHLPTITRYWYSYVEKNIGPAKSWEALKAEYLLARAEQLSSFINVAEIHNYTNRNSQRLVLSNREALRNKVSVFLFFVITDFIFKL